MPSETAALLRTLYRQALHRMDPEERGTSVSKSKWLNTLVMSRRDIEAEKEHAAHKVNTTSIASL